MQGMTGKQDGCYTQWTDFNGTVFTWSNYCGKSTVKIQLAAHDKDKSKTYGRDVLSGFFD